MTLLTVLAALLIEHVLREFRPTRDHGWFQHYCRVLTRTDYLQWLLARPFGAALALLPPLALIGWLQLVAGDVGGLLALVFGTFVLLFSLGPKDLRDETGAFLQARDSGNQDDAIAAAQGLCLTQVPEQEPRRSFAVARAVVILANKRLIGPLFWFVVLGPVGAAAFRAIHLLDEYLHAQACPTEMSRATGLLKFASDWAPARVTAAGYAVAGSFDAVAHAWRSFYHEPGVGLHDEAEHLLAQTGLAALDTFPDDADELDTPLDDTIAPSTIPPVVEDAMALVRRGLAIGLALIAGGTLVAAFA